MSRVRKIGIMGTGTIAGTMAGTVKEMPDVECVAVASRTQEKAEDFAKKFGIPKAYDSYEQLVRDTEVELVYVATPHSEHEKNCILCIEHGKPVLCEKAFTANAEQAKRVISLAEEKKVFITEAIWTRYMPLLADIRSMISSGIIGDVSMLTCNLGYMIANIDRLTNPALAGGALLDVGVYTLNFAAMIFGDQIDKISSSCIYTDTGVDASNSITLQFKDGKMAVLNSTIKGISDRKGIIYGTKGYLIVENINNFESVTAYDKEHHEVKCMKRPEQITGYEYEVSASFAAMERNALECSEMPHRETIRIMEIMDELRKEWNIVYPFEM